MIPTVSKAIGVVFLKPHSGRYVRFKTLVVDGHNAYQPISERELTDEELAHFEALVQQMQPSSNDKEQRGII
jgi:hypothetical protein